MSTNDYNQGPYTVVTDQRSPMVNVQDYELNQRELSLQKHFERVNFDSPSSVRNLMPATSNIGLTPVIESMDDLRLLST